MQETLKFSPVKTGVAFLPMVAALAGMAQVSNRVLLPRFGPKVIVPIGLLMNAAALYLLNRVGLHSSYVSHVLPYLLLLGLGFGLSLAPSFSTGTLGLKPQDAGVGSATLNTSQQVGGSIGTALLNTLAAGAVTAYLVGRAITPANLQAAALHSYTTAFLCSSLIFVVAAVIAESIPVDPPPGVVPASKRGNSRLSSRCRLLASSQAEPGTVLAVPQVRVAARWISCSRAASIEIGGRSGRRRRSQEASQTCAATGQPSTPRYPGR